MSALTATRYATIAAAPVRRAATDRRVRRESRRAAVNAALAWRRAERVGLAHAYGDRRVARRLRRAQRHLSRAAAFSVSPPPRHRIRNAALLVAGIGVGCAAVVAGRCAARGWCGAGDADAEGSGAAGAIRGEYVS